MGKLLSRVYVTKIVITILLWSIPLLVFPPRLMTTLGFPELEAMLFLRLLGWAYLALCVGYYFGWRNARNGVFDPAAFTMGIVSNGGAFIFLTYYAITAAWSDWGFLAQLFMWISLAATLAITSGLSYGAVQFRQQIKY